MGVRGSGGPRSRVWDPRFGVWEALFDHFWTTIWGRPSRAAPKHQTAPSLWIWEGSRPPQRGRFWVIFGPFLTILGEAPWRGPSLRATGIWMFRARGPKNDKNWAIFRHFLSNFCGSSERRGKGGGSFFDFRPFGGLKYVVQNNKLGNFSHSTEMRKIG